MKKTILIFLICACGPKSGSDTGTESSTTESDPETTSQSGSTTSGETPTTDDISPTTSLQETSSSESSSESSTTETLECPLLIEGLHFGRCHSGNVCTQGFCKSTRLGNICTPSCGECGDLAGCGDTVCGISGECNLICPCKLQGMICDQDICVWPNE